MLPETVDRDLFDVRHQVGDMALEFICSKIEEYGFVVSEQENMDLVILIRFTKGSDYGELRIDRCKKEFDICAVIDGETIFPVTGCWEIIQQFLAAVVQVVDSRL